MWQKGPQTQKQVPIRWPMLPQPRPTSGCVLSEWAPPVCFGSESHTVSQYHKSTQGVSPATLIALGVVGSRYFWGFVSLMLRTVTVFIVNGHIRSKTLLRTKEQVPVHISRSTWVLDPNTQRRSNQPWMT